MLYTQGFLWPAAAKLVLVNSHRVDRDFLQASGVGQLRRTIAIAEIQANLTELTAPATANRF